MSVREEYAGTERRCPKCQGKFTVPAGGGTPSAGDGPASRPDSAADDFDPVAFLTGQTKTPPSKAKPPALPGRSDRPSPPKTPGDDFDPLEVLTGGGASPTPPASPGSQPGTPQAAGTPASSPPGAPTPPQPKRPAWAKPPPPEERPEETDQPPAELQRPQPKRPSWAKPPPPAEKPDWLDEPPTEPERPRPKRPAWAKPLPGEQAAPANAPGAVAPDASAAARAAAEAVAQTTATVSADNPALQVEQPRGPLIDVRAMAVAIRRRVRLMAVTTVTALVLFGASWGVVGPRHVSFQVIGRNEKLTLVPVEGRVTMNGRPLAGARVIFHPEGRSFRSPEAVTDDEGHYRLRFCDGYAGAPPGKYRVEVVLIGPQGQDVVPLDAEYGHFRRRSHEVPPNGGAIDIAIPTASGQR